MYVPSSFTLECRHLSIRYYVIGGGPLFDLKKRGSVLSRPVFLAVVLLTSKGGGLSKVERDS